MEICKEDELNRCSKVQEGVAFQQALDRYVRRFLIKGIPSLFSELKGLYRYVFHRNIHRFYSHLLCDRSL